MLYLHSDICSPKFPQGEQSVPTEETVSFRLGNSLFPLSLLFWNCLITKHLIYIKAIITLSFHQNYHLYEGFVKAQTPSLHMLTNLYSIL